MDMWQIIRVEISFIATCKGFRNGAESNEENSSLTEAFELRRFDCDRNK